ncbi:MAG: DNA-deoxyinosine glycosylase [Lachnospiraceae bacterium]|nr:DNA-deoxyinosine glycosylase [Lachnospiraceae bacterium]
MQSYQRIIHPFGPLYDKNSEILILGSFPSVKSREQQFFYGHPQNRFWKVTAGVLSVPVPQTIEEKKAMLHENHIALWDVIAECEIIGSSDSSIRNVTPTDLSRILECARIRQIYANGNTAKKMFEKYQKKTLGRDVIGLPSTSPANAAWSVERLQDAWGAALKVGELHHA